MAASFASLAVSLARRSSADRPAAAEAVASAGQVGVVNADDGREAAGTVAGYGSWSCAGMREGPFGGSAEAVWRGAAWAGRSDRLTGERGRLEVGRGGQTQGLVGGARW